MLEQLKQKVCEANLNLVKYNLVILTWGNVSQIDRKANLVAIKPSGVEYSQLTPDKITITDLDGNIVDGNLKPSSDLLTHLELYKADNSIGGIVHTHSAYATAFAQAGKAIENFGTTQSDYFYNNIPCTRDLTPSEIEDNYELQTGKVIIDTFNYLKLNFTEVPACLVKNHAPFVWGKDCFDAVQMSYILEEIAKMNFYTLQINNQAQRISQHLQNKHYLRKHGKNAYYGQKDDKL